MKRPVVVLLTFVTISTALATGGYAQESNAVEPTIVAYQTEVANKQETIDLQATEVAALRTRVADLAVSDNEMTSDAPDLEASAMGEAVQVGAWEVTVTGTDVRDKIRSDLWQDTYRPKGIFVVIFVSITNLGVEPERFPSTQFDLKDSRGRVYGWFDDQTFAIAAITDQELGNSETWRDPEPGFSYPMALVFDVPADAVGFTLFVEDEPFAIALDR